MLVTSRSSFQKLFSIVLVILITAIHPAFPQLKNNKRDLEKKKEKLVKEIDETNRMLKLNAKNKNATQAQLLQLQKKLKARQELINTINQQLSELSGAINQTTSDIASMQSKMSQLKKEYAAMIQYAYKNGNAYQRIMFIFSSDDFNQAFKRLKYLQEYSEYRKQQAREIENIQYSLGVKKTQLELQKKEKVSLKIGEEGEKLNITKEKSEQEKLMKNLTVQESTLRKQLAQKQAQKKKLEAAIESAIKKEIEAAKKKAAAAGKKNVTKENAIALSLTPEAQKLSDNFSGNRGLLPWPVEQGAITEYFGEHAHPTLKGVTVKNDGIDIGTNRGAGARSIFQGEVTAVISLPGSGSAVIVRHGVYLSVYSNLETVTVKKGDKLNTREKIGTVSYDAENGRGLINLQIWKGFDKLNPQVWLARK